MPTLNGLLTLTGSLGQLPSRAGIDWSEDLVAGWDYQTYIDLISPTLLDSQKTAKTIQGLWAWNDPAITGYSKNTTEGISYITDFYNRIHLIPKVLDMGSMISAETRNVYVWNAYFIPKLLESITMENAEGINIEMNVPSRPPTFSALEFRHYLVSVSLEGPAMIEAEIHFNFEAEIDVRILPITGSRVILFAWEPNWEFTEKLIWMTDILETRKGEQRIAVRDAPRQAFQYTFVLGEQQFAIAKQLADQWNCRVWGLPVWIEYAVASANIGATEIIFDTSQADWRPDGLGAFWKSADEFEIFQVVTVEANKVTIKSPLAHTWSNTWVMPVRLARTPEGIEFKHPVNKRLYSEVNAEFLVEDTVYLGDSDYPEYDGYEIYEDVNAQMKEASERIRLPQVEFDNGQGPVIYDYEQDYSDFSLTLGKRASRKAGFWAWRQWLHKRRGKQKPFLMPSWNADFIVLAPIGETGQELTCASTGLVRYGTFPFYIRLATADGNIYYRKVMSAEYGNPGEEKLLLNSPLGKSYVAADFRLVSYLYLVRLNTDEAKMDYYGHFYSKTNLPIMRVPA